MRAWVEKFSANFSPRLCCLRKLLDLSLPQKLLDLSVPRYLEEEGEAGRRDGGRAKVFTKGANDARA